MSSNYKLTKISQDENVLSKTYEFSLPRSNKPTSKNNKKRTPSANYSQAKNRNVSRNVNVNDAKPRKDIPSYSSKIAAYHLESTSNNGKVSQKVYEMDISTPAPKRISSRYMQNEKGYQGHYIHKKNGKTVYAKTKADAIKAKQEDIAEVNKQEAKRFIDWQEKKAEQALKVIKLKGNKQVPVKAIVSIAICTILFLSIVFSSVMINERNMDLNDLNSQYSELLERQKELQATLDSRYDYAYLEDYAVTRLGMVNTDKVSRQYIYLTRDEKIELSDGSNEASTQSSFKRFINSLIEKFNDFIYYFQ